MNILVTGANGQLGRHMQLLGGTSRHKYLFTDVDELDITRRDAVFNYVLTNEIAVVVNCAAYTNVDRAEDEEDVAEAVNCGAVRYLADAMKVVGGTLIHISTDYVFGGNNYNTPCCEEAATCPTGAYGRTKLHGEQAIASVGCHSIIIRSSWLYSEYGKNFLKTMMAVLPSCGSRGVVFDQVGTPTYAGDLAKVIFRIVEDENYIGNEGIYHFSNEGVCSWYDFALAIAKTAQIDNCHVVPCHSDEFPSKVVRPAFSVLDKSKIKATFGVEIPHWTESLQVCVDNIRRMEVNNEI